MSSYRDDTQETAIISDATWLGVSAVVEETARIADTVLFGLETLVVETATASDQVLDRAAIVIVEQATAADEVHDQLHASVLLQDEIRISETLSARIRVLHEDSAKAADQIIGRFRAFVEDSARIEDEVRAQRRATDTVTEQARARAFAIGYRKDTIEESAVAADSVIDVLRARVQVVESATVADAVIDARATRPGIVIETAHAAEMVLDRLHAVSLTNELAVMEDWTPARGGQAWTANGDTWAMSRYAPYATHGLVVIDGALYVMGDDGLYTLGDGEMISGRLATGKLDLGKDVLVHPRASYLEYELADGGEATLDVTTTQGGHTATYRYALPARVAEELTEGRFVLGRGLCGRHFRFALNVSALHAYINDWRVESAATKRRM